MKSPELYIPPTGPRELQSKINIFFLLFLLLTEKYVGQESVQLLIEMNLDF